VHASKFFPSKNQQFTAKTYIKGLIIPTSTRRHLLQAKATAILVLLFFASLFSHAAILPAQQPITIEGLGKATVRIDGTWQFHLGDDLTWASPTLDDSTWESIQTNKPWGAQQHFGYSGYAWYRRHIDFVPGPSDKLDLSLAIGYVSDVYEVYWNGTKIGGYGRMPPHHRSYWGNLPQVYNLGKPEPGVLAIRVWNNIPASSDSGLAGGLYAPPYLGTPDAISALLTSGKYLWLKASQYSFALILLYALVAILSLLAWLQDRSRRLLLWMSLFAFAPAVLTILGGFRIPFPFNIIQAIQQPFFSVLDICLWFLLLYLLQLEDHPRLVRWTRIFAWVSIISTSLDGLLILYWGFWNGRFSQIADAVVTVTFTAVEVWPLVLIYFGFRKKLGTPTWLVVVFAFLSQMLLVIKAAALQGERFTHWTLGSMIDRPIFSVNDNPFNLTVIVDTLLFVSIVYAVYRYSVDQTKRQLAVEQEFKSAQELQRVLIPETLPPIPGFAVTSAYRPAAQVGGDFFQLIAKAEGSSLFILGDVSGKGLKAAMTVSLLVGTVRTLAEIHDDPAEILSGLNRRIHGRMQNGFVTCLILRLDPDGLCTFANAGHLPPYLNQNELHLPPELPLGLVPSASYDKVTIKLEVGDRLTLYTDGLLEARSPSGEIFSFDRLQDLIATKPDARQASDAAVSFGQEDDITVLTITRLATGVESTTVLEAPTLVPLTA
jgi:Stage II sporulation protein E (SpoIIE)